MSTTQNATVESNIRPEYDDEIQKIADYVLNYSIDNDSPNSADAWNTARHCLMDTLGCGLLALRFPECTKHLGPDCADQITTNKDLALKPAGECRFTFQREFGSHVMENILFKISFPAEFHAQTACGAAVILHPMVDDRIDEIEKIVLTTHDSAIRIFSKEGALANPADRDHCLQYMVAVPLNSSVRFYFYELYFYQFFTSLLPSYRLTCPIDKTTRLGGSHPIKYF